MTRLLFYAITCAILGLSGPVWGASLACPQSMCADRAVDGTAPLQLHSVAVGLTSKEHLIDVRARRRAIVPLEKSTEITKMVHAPPRLSSDTHGVLSAQASGRYVASFYWPPPLTTQTEACRSPAVYDELPR